MFIQPSELQKAITLEQITCRANQFHVDTYHPALFTEHGITLPDEIKRSVPKRQAEFLAGRFSALQAIHEIDQSITNIPIGLNRSPSLPDHIVATITHTDGIALCMAAKKSDVSYLGADIEKIIVEKTAFEIEKSIITPQEKQILNNLDIDFPIALSLVFSAKESLFKALHPFVQRYFDFSAAKLTKICLQTQSFEFFLTEDLHPQFHQHDLLQGQFFYNKEHVLTCVSKHYIPTKT